MINKYKYDQLGTFTNCEKGKPGDADASTTYLDWTQKNSIFSNSKCSPLWKAKYWHKIFKYFSEEKFSVFGNDDCTSSSSIEPSLVC